MAYVIDGQLWPKVTRNLSTGHHSSRALDTVPELARIRPADIENITVFRGPEAETRYGVCPGHGVVVISTKRVKPKE